MGHKRDGLARARRAAGYTQEQLAEALVIDRSTIGRWESGTTEPLPYIRQKLVRLLGLSRMELERLLTTPPAVVMDEARPAGSAVVTTTTDDELSSIATAAACESLQFVNHTTEGAASHGLLEHLRWEVSRLAVDYVHTPVRDLFRDLVEVRDTIFGLLDKRQRAQHLQELYFLGGASCVLLAHASQNVGSLRSAIAQLRTAWTCADLADHDALRAWSRGTAALIDEWSLHQSQAVDAAGRGSQFPASTESHIRLAAIEARAAARMRHRTRALAALDRLRALQEAEASIASDEVVELGGLLSFPSAKQHYYIGSTYGLLGEHETAEQYAQAAIQMYETGLRADRSYGDEALARLDIVNARLSCGDLDGATEAIAPIVVLPEEQRIKQLDAAVGRTRAMLEAPQFQQSSGGRDLLDGLRRYEQPAHKPVRTLQSPR